MLGALGAQRNQLQTDVESRLGMSFRHGVPGIQSQPGYPICGEPMISASLYSIPVECSCATHSNQSDSVHYAGMA